MSHTGIVYDDIFMKHETLPGHPERAERLGAIIWHAVGNGAVSAGEEAIRP